jgi:hypothetical protein
VHVVASRRQKWTPTTMQQTTTALPLKSRYITLLIYTIPGMLMVLSQCICLCMLVLFVYYIV